MDFLLFPIWNSSLAEERQLPAFYIIIIISIFFILFFPFFFFSCLFFRPAVICLNERAVNAAIQLSFFCGCFVFSFSWMEYTYTYSSEGINARPPPHKSSTAPSFLPLFFLPSLYFLYIFYLSSVRLLLYSIYKSIGWSFWILVCADAHTAHRQLTPKFSGILDDPPTSSTLQTFPYGARKTPRLELQLGVQKHTYWK